MSIGTPIIKSVNSRPLKPKFLLIDFTVIYKITPPNKFFCKTLKDKIKIGILFPYLLKDFTMTSCIN